MKKAKLITFSAVVMTMVMSSIVPAFAYSKEETVYSKLKTNGSEKTTVVSEHLINDQNETSLDDQSSLKNIKNVNGKETFKQDGSSLVWQTTDGQDIYYQGKTTNSLPVSMKVTYKLDGKKTKLKDMLGKKGKVEIQIDYTNNDDVMAAALFYQYLSEKDSEFLINNNYTKEEVLSGFKQLLVQSEYNNLLYMIKDDE